MRIYNRIIDLAFLMLLILIVGYVIIHASIKDRSICKDFLAVCS